MKILWLSHLVPYPPKGGVLQRSYNLIKETCKYHDVTLLAYTQTDLLNSMFVSVEDGKKQAKVHLGSFCEDIEFINIPCESSSQGKPQLALKSLFTSDPYTVNWLKSREMRIAIRKRLNESSYDLIHFDTISLAPFIDEFICGPKVLDHHNIESHMIFRRIEHIRNPLKKLYFYLEGQKLLRYEKRMCPEFDLHITCSSTDSARLLEISPNLNIREVPNGVDIDYFYPQYDNEQQNNLIFAGGLTWYPNKDAMMHFAKNIWPLLKKVNPQIIMNVVGKAPPEELRNLASTDNNYIVHGFVDDVREYISRASIYVCPIRDGGGTKLKLLDAFAMGMATVAHPTACEGLDITDGENVMLASTPEEFVAKISLLNANPQLRRMIGMNARELVVRKYAFSSIGKNLSDMYNDIKNINPQNSALQN